MMDARLQTRVQRYGWDAATAYYQDGWHVQLKSSHDILMSVAKLESGQRVIETACGSGLVTRLIADSVGPDGSVFATDLSENMIAALKQNLDEKAYPFVTAERMDAENLDVSDNAFDVGICALGLMYTPNPQTAVDELARVVRRGGRLAATVWGERRNCGWAEVFPIVDAHVSSEVCPLFFATGGPGVLAGAFKKAGVSEIDEVRHAEVLEFGSAEDVTKAVLMGGPVALAVKRFSDDVCGTVKEDFLASVQEFKNTDGSYSIPGEFVTVCGQLSQV